LQDLRAKVISGFAWESSTKLFVQILSWVSTIWVARILTPSDYGIVAISGVFVGLCLKLAGMGLGSAIVNKKSVSKSDLDNFFWVSNALAILAYLLLYNLSPFISEYYEVPELNSVLRVASLIIFVSSLSIVPRALLDRAMKFKHTAIINGIASTSITVSALAMAFSGFGYWTLIYSTILGEVIMAAGVYIAHPYLPSGFGSFGNNRASYKYGANVLGSRIIDHINNQWVTIIGGAVLGKTLVGSYQMARTIALIPLSKISEIIFKIIFASFSRIQDDIPRSKKIFIQMYRYLLLASAPMFSGIALVSDELILLLLGEKWLTALIPIKIICISNIFMISNFFFYKVLDGLGRSDISLKYQLIGLIAFPTLIYYASSWGLNAMLMAWFIVIPIGFIYLTMQIFKVLDLTLYEFFQTVLPSLASTLGMTAVLIAMNSILLASELPSAYILTLKILMGSFTYFTLLLIFFRSSFREVLTLIRSN